jgi:hypothetical protein
MLMISPERRILILLAGMIAALRYDCRVPAFTISRLREANFLLLFNGDRSVTVRPPPPTAARPA